METKSGHPFYPQDSDFPGCEPQSREMVEIIGIFGVAVVIAVVFTLFLSRGSKQLSGLERAILCWWVVTGLIHLFLEGAFAISPGFHTWKSKNFFIDVWKEYSKGDSRYASRDPFVVAMETVTAFLWGPGSFLVAYAILKGKGYRHPAQLLVSLGQLYGDVLYFGTCFLEGFVHSRPEPLYFWGYFVFMNAIWIVVPTLLICQSWRCITLQMGSGQGSKRTSKKRE